MMVLLKVAIPGNVVFLTLRNSCKNSCSSAINRKKAECLIKLQTVTSMLTGHVVEHYKKKMEERSGPKR
jgi:hypothetical protein